MENTYHCYANRELSWLRFNERVLEEAEDSRLPLCERLSFLSIFQSNLDEFFMVRIGSLQDQMLLDKNARENKTNMTSGEQIDAALAFIHKLTARRDAAYNGLLEQLAEQGIRLLDFAHMEEESRTELEKLFRQDYLPLLSSFIISKKQAFPFLKNKGIYAVAVLSTKAEKKKIGIVPCGNEIFPRLVPVPGRTGCFILSEELILHFLPLLYKGYKVTSKTLARITRNAAYGSTDADWNTCVKKLCVETVQCLKQTQLLFFPVPKYGRGPEILLLLKRFAPNLKFYGDAHFLRQLQQIQLGGPWLLPVPPHFADWVQPDAILSREKGVVFLSGPQLAGKAGQRAREMVAHGAHGIMTGTPDAGSLSAEMLKNGQMLFLRYPVHLDAMQCRELAEKNQFGRVIPYHSPEIDCPCFFLL